MQDRLKREKQSRLREFSQGGYLHFLFSHSVFYPSGEVSDTYIKLWSANSFSFEESKIWSLIKQSGVLTLSQTSTFYVSGVQVFRKYGGKRRSCLLMLLSKNIRSFSVTFFPCPNLWPFFPWLFFPMTSFFHDFFPCDFFNHQSNNCREEGKHYIPVYPQFYPFPPYPVF